MKLHDAVVQGLWCGLETVAECVLNAQMHYISMLPYSEMQDEELELLEELKRFETGNLTLDWDNIHQEVYETQLEYENWSDGLH